MTTDPRPGDASNRPTDPADPSRRPPWVAPLVGVVVLAVLAYAAMQGWRFMQQPQTAATKPVEPARPGRPMFTFTGTVSRTGKDGQKEAAKDATVVVYQPTWESEQQKEWEQRTNEMIAKACREMGPGDPPPTVTADPASVRRADEAMARRQQVAKSGAAWGHRCSAAFLDLLKESAIELRRATTGPDGAYSITTLPPAGIPYIVHAKSADAEWLDKVAGRGNRLDLNDGNRIPE